LLRSRSDSPSLGIHHTFSNRNKSLNPQIARWAVLLQEYEIVYRYRKGEQMKTSKTCTNQVLQFQKFE
jgi:hypothetical protein